MNRVTITKVNGGLGRRLPLTDMVSGLIANYPAIAGIPYKSPLRLRSVDDAIALGLTAALDESNSAVLYEHIKEFFRISPDGVLWLMLVSQATTFADMLDPTIADGAKKMLIHAKGEINQLGVAFNPIAPVANDTALLAAIPKAQLLVDSEYTADRPLHVILEGRGLDLDIIPDLHALNASGVSVTASQNPEVVARITGADTYAAVGTALGAVSLAAVNESIAWVQKFNLLGDNLQSWGIGGLSSAEISPSILEDLNDAGFLFLINHANYPGIYFNDSWTCADLESDFLKIENCRTINKATRLIRPAMLPHLNAPVRVHPQTGRLAPEFVKWLEGEGIKVMEEGMEKPGELSGFTFFIDEEQNILADPTLRCELSIIPTGSANNILVQIGFTNPFNS